MIPPITEENDGGNLEKTHLSGHSPLEDQSRSIPTEEGLLKKSPQNRG